MSREKIQPKGPQYTTEADVVARSSIWAELNKHAHDLMTVMPENVPAEVKHHFNGKRACAAAFMHYLEQNRHRAPTPGLVNALTEAACEEGRNISHGQAWSAGLREASASIWGFYEGMVQGMFHVSLVNGIEMDQEIFLSGAAEG